MKKKLASYSKIVGIIPQITELKSLDENLAKFRSVTLALQDDCLDLHDARIPFDEIMTVNSEPEVNEHSHIVHVPMFEGAVIKIPLSEERLLLPDEAESVKVY